jgi:hypothetical protein
MEFFLKLASPKSLLELHLTLLKEAFVQGCVINTAKHFEESKIIGSED